MQQGHEPSRSAQTECGNRPRGDAGPRPAFTGKARWFPDHWQMNMPQVQPVEDLQQQSEIEILPVYPLTEDLRVEQLRPVLRRAVEAFADCLLERLPEAVRQRRQFP